MFTQIRTSIFVLSARLVSQPLPLSFLLTVHILPSSMKTSVSSSNVMIWTKVWETSSQKGKPWLSQNQSLTLIAIRSAKMTVREASVGEESVIAFVTWLLFELCCEARQLRGTVDFILSSFIIWELLFLSLCLWGGFCNLH